MKRKFLERLWVPMVRNVAALSTCERTKVGCLLLSLDGERLLAYGYNGTYRGGPNAPAVDEPGNPHWVHAEANALVKTRPVEPFVALVTHTPCYQCAMLLINAQVVAVYALERYRLSEGWDLLTRELGSSPDRGAFILDLDREPSP